MSEELQENSGTTPRDASSDTIQQVKLLSQQELSRADLNSIRVLAKTDSELVLSALMQSDSALMPPELRLLKGQLQLAKAREIEPLDSCIRLAHQHVTQFPNDVSSVRPLLKSALMMEDKSQVEVIDSIFSMLPPTLTVLSYRALWAGLWFPHRASEAASQLRKEIAAVKQQRLVSLVQQDKGFAELIAMVSLARNIAIVGSGPSLQGAKQGAKIDAHDLVVRMNFPPIGSFAEDVGSLTSVGFTRLAPTHPLFKELISRHESYQSALVVQASRSPKMYYTPFSTDDLAAANVSRFARVPTPAWNLVLDLSYPFPTMGFGAIVFIALLLDRPVSIFGFDFFETEVPHFWSPRRQNYWAKHDPQFEKRMVEKLLKIHFGIV